MKKFLLLFFFSLIIAACTSDTHDSYNKPIHMSNYKGRWVIINYWATWCKPCLTELPVLNNFYKSFAQQVMVLGVNYDHLSNEEINRFIGPLNISFPMMKSFPMEKYGVKNINIIPITFIFSPQGTLVATLNGSQTEKSLKAAIGIK